MYRVPFPQPKIEVSIQVCSKVETVYLLPVVRIYFIYQSEAIRTRAILPLYHFLFDIENKKDNNTPPIQKLKLKQS